MSLITGLGCGDKETRYRGPQPQPDEVVENQEMRPYRL